MQSGPVGRLADERLLRFADAVRDERDQSPDVLDEQGAIPGFGQLARDISEPAQQRVEVALVGQGEVRVQQEPDSPRQRG